VIVFKLTLGSKCFMVGILEFCPLDLWSIAINT
jgi:hypothetical protein